MIHDSDVGDRDRSLSTCGDELRIMDQAFLESKNQRLVVEFYDDMPHKKTMRKAKAISFHVALCRSVLRHNNGDLI